MADKPKTRPRDPAQLAKLIVDIATGEVEDHADTTEKRGNSAAAALGRLGGKARAEKMSAERRTEIAKNAARTRYSKTK